MATTHRRTVIAGRAALTAVLLTLVVACVPPATTQYVAAVAPQCPLDRSVVMYGGDSLAGHWPLFVTLPTGVTAFNTARGGSAFGGNYTDDPTMDTIGARVLAQLNACGNTVGVVAISGGINDLNQGQPPSGTINAIRALDAELFRRGVAVVLLTIHPIAPNTELARTIQAHRRAVNAWMTASGNLHAHVVDCTGALESSPGSDVLKFDYWTFENLLTVDPQHMNDNGYAAMAACARPAILAALG